MATGDVKENEMTKVTDLVNNDYVRVVTTSGVSALIKKSDLFPVYVGEIDIDGVKIKARVTLFFVEIMITGICTSRILKDVVIPNINLSSSEEKKNFKVPNGYLSTRTYNAIYVDIAVGSDMSSGFMGGGLSFVYSRKL